MEYSKLPVAKRTRSGCNRFIEEEYKRLQSSGSVTPVPEVEYVVLDDDDDGDEGLSGDERGKSKKSRWESKKGISELDHKDKSASDSDVIVMEDTDDSLTSIEEPDSDFVEISVVDKGEGEKIIETIVYDNDDEEDDGYVREDMPVNLHSFDSLSSEDFSDYSDESYRGDEGFIGSDHGGSSLDDSRSYAESKDEGNNVSDDDYEIECRVKKRNDDVQRKGRGKLVEGRGRKNDRGNKEIVDGRFKDKVETFELEESRSCNDESDDSVEEIDGPDYETSDGRKNGKRIVKSGFRKRSQNVADPRKDGLQSCSLAESDDDKRGGEYVNKNCGGRWKSMKMGTRRKSKKDHEAEKFLVDGIAGMVESRQKSEKEETQYKFWFTDKKPVEISELDKELDGLFEEMNTYLACEDIGSTPLEVDNVDHSKMQSDCSRGNHYLVLDEQIGRVCKYCSHVSQEMRHILPDFSNSYSPGRRRSYFVQPECPILFDHFQDTGCERHDYEDCNTIGTVWDLVPGARSSMYQHQREGFEFIWNNLAGGTITEKLEKPLSSSGSGCIISHAPGTGKTRLTIVFLQSFMRLYPDTRPVIIAPKSMLLTWEEEFKKWKINLPFHNMNNPEFSGQENLEAVSTLRKGKDRRNSITLTRLVKLFSWKKDKSILGITYTLFDRLVRAETRNADCTPSEEQMGNALLKLPTLIVLDEGHTPRNDQSGLYNSLLDVETERRIILSGTPFQNNFVELHNTLRLVNPKFDGAMKKRLRRICKELKSNWSGHKLMELKHMISPFVHVHKGKILQSRCPGLKDALIHLQLTDLQEELIAALKINDSENNYLTLSHVISLVSVHPSLLPEGCLPEPQSSGYRDKLKRLKSNPYSGAKTKFVIELCRLSVALKEKVLIYSQYLDPLVIIREQILSYFGWTEGREVLYMDGTLEAKQRQSSICALNDPRSKARVLLASIKACSEGINLVGASRVVLLDVVWNPSVERQAISRAYRLGQEKIVYTYHLIAEEMEIQKYKVQTAKDRVSEMVFSSKDMDSLQENMQDMVSEDRILQEMYQQNDKLGGLFKQIVYQPKALNMVDTFDMVAEEYIERKSRGDSKRVS
ncbi:SNF2 domain-containing protein CLASSY 3-like [Heracleum sosnowskyi]|uniref:SNF2 domain-containing protein CLASSY 3-like n=1 Tax=Heracleum sosnowskyi TaxID=360622 RepID=A0AAD8GQM1_9APIA|nr:SNF2 domain-containing protein CLASSY 3-like [Heracleum sosnowskyi]